MEIKWIEQAVEEVKEEVVALRRDFHEHPELGTEEVRTSAIVEKYLNDLGIETVRMYNTGVVGCLEGGKPGKCLLLRADMDALPMQEENDVPYRSQTPGVMHACGHDGHTAMLLCAAKILAAHKDEFAGTVKFVFQPNEEEIGAAFLVKEGVLDHPPVDASFGMHLWSQVPTGHIGLAAGPVMSEMVTFDITLTGESVHSSDPSKGIDPILCAANIIQTVQMLQTREIAPMDAMSLVIGKINGGTKGNIVAGQVEMQGNMRYMFDGSDESERHPRVRFRRIVESIAAAHRVKAEIKFTVEDYEVDNDPEMVQFIRSQVAPDLVTEDKIVEYRVMASEDFSELMSHNGIPGVFMFVGVGDHEKGTDNPHHSVCFNIDEDMLPLGVKAFVKTAMEYLR